MAVSNDVDFLGTSRVARALHQALAGSNWKLWEPRMDDATSKTAKLSQSLPEGIKQIDFLDGLIGMSAAEVQARMLDPLAAMPVAHVPHEPFRAQRWPRIEAHVARCRASYARRRKRRDLGSSSS